MTDTYSKVNILFQKLRINLIDQYSYYRINEYIKLPIRVSLGTQSSRKSPILKLIFGF